MTSVDVHLHNPVSPPARIAALPMYDPPELQSANDALWSAISQRLTAGGIAGVPARLTRAPLPDPAWSDPDLLLSQTCGYPLVTRLMGRVQIVATPGYDVEGCDGPRHRSALVVRARDPANTLADLRDHRCAINDGASNTGMNLLRVSIAPLAGEARFFHSVVVTGSHAASAEAVVAGDADLASIDCITLYHLRRFRPELKRELRVLGWTRASPGLPLITGAATTPAELTIIRTALADAIHDPGLKAARRTLRISRFHNLPAALYQRIHKIEQSAIAEGYPVLI